MNRKGILFEGLKVRPKAVCAEECREDQIRETSTYTYQVEMVSVDVTYFLTFAMAQNRICQEEIKKLPSASILHFQELFREYPYQGEYFLSCLGYEEYFYAQILLGMLCEIREGADEPAKETYNHYVAFLKKGWHGVRKELFSQDTIPFAKVQNWAGLYTEQPAMGLSQIGVAFVLAECFHVDILADRNYYLLLDCMMDRNLLWNSSREAVMDCSGVGKSRPQTRDFFQFLKSRMKYPCQAALGFRTDAHNEFDYYLQNLFHLGGIDRNVIRGEAIDEKTGNILIELGNFQENLSLSGYVYSLYIVLLSQYVRKCLERIRKENPAVWRNQIEDAREAEKRSRTECERLKRQIQEGEKQKKRLKEALEESEKAVRRKEHQIQRTYKQQEEEKRELIQLREEKFLVDKGKKEYYTKTQQ